jgi:hypothetical protein
MFDFDALCPHCEKKIKLRMIGLEAKEFIQMSSLPKNHKTRLR